MMFHYTVEYWDDYEKEEKTESGVIASVDMGSAVNRVVEFYGKENIGSVSIYELEDVLTYDELDVIIH